MPDKSELLLQFGLFGRFSLKKREKSAKEICKTFLVELNYTLSV